MDELLQYYQMLLQYAQDNAANLNAESQKALGAFIYQFTETIQNQMGNLNAPSPVPPDEIPPLETSMPSSNVNSFSYNPDNQEMFVKFQGDYPSENGPVYKYGGVPPVIFDLFQKGAVPARTKGSNDWGEWWEGKVPSLGASLFTLIKNGGYPYERITS